MGKTKQEILASFPEIKTYLEKIIAAFEPEKVILFGSKTTDKPDPKSDADFAVVSRRSFDENHITGALDIVNYRKADAYLQQKIDEEGIVLYERDDKKVS